MDWTAVKSILKSAEGVFYMNLTQENSLKDNWQFFKDTIIKAVKQFVPWGSSLPHLCVDAITYDEWLDLSKDLTQH